MKNQDILAVRKKLGISRKEFSDALQFSLDQEKKLKLWEEGAEEIPADIYERIMAFHT